MNILDNGIEVYGVSENIPMISSYFKEFDFQLNKKIDNNNLIMDKILSVNVNMNVGQVEIIKTPIMMSNEGVFFSGYKLKVDLVIDLKAKYILESEPKTLGFAKEKLMKTIYIVLPLEYKNNNMVDLLRKKKITINPYTEDIYCEVRGANRIYFNISAVVIAHFIN